ncbi:hypothetical protein GCM10009560_64970 [Nonomuraea longicatena]|uniref:Methyltransferase domain-containing protein n=2 Tax=Nonomuraea longicatena TaxID=83682 RepID=A0ABP4BAY3_9ACTN
MSDTVGSAEEAVAYIYNSAVAASALSAAWDLGMLDELHDRGEIDAPDFAARRQLDPRSTVGLLRALAAVGIVHRDGTKAVPAAYFAEAYRTRAFFHWLMRGSAQLFREIPEVMMEKNRHGEFCRRDSSAIARACREISALTYDPWFWQAVENLEFKPRRIVDLGCGSGERILRLLRRFPETHGIGIDIAAAAIKDAADDADTADLAARVSFLEADVRTMQSRETFDDVELITCFMMGHDFWPRDDCIGQLRRIRALFPNARRFLLGDATRSAVTHDRKFRTFTLGFELAHDLMGKFLPTVPDWESVFGEGGWSVRRRHFIDLAVGEVIFELDPA